MEQQKVEVSAYAGYRSGERPRSFVLEGEKIIIEEIVSRWVEEGVKDRQQKRFFRVKGDNGFSLPAFVHRTVRGVVSGVIFCLRRNAFRVSNLLDIQVIGRPGGLIFVIRYPGGKDKKDISGSRNSCRHCRDGPEGLSQTHAFQKPAITGL